MSDSTTAIGAAEATSRPPAEPRWPAMLVFFTGWWLPATTARRTQHISLKEAFCIHLFAAVLMAVLAAVIGCWASGESIAEVAGEIGEEIEREYRRDPAEVTVVIAASVASVEGGTVLLALLLGPWGARDEKIRLSIANALRNTWLFTAAAIPWVIAIVLLAGTLEHTRYTIFQSPQWQAAVNEYHQAVTAALTRPALEQQQMLAQLNDPYSYYRFKFLQPWPWYVRHNDEIIIGSMLTGAALMWLTLLRAISARRDALPIVRPPMCERCGYNLQGTAMEGRCPECGTAVIESLGEDVRRGTAWDRRRARGRLRAWWQTAAEALARPAELGRQLQVAARADDYRRFLWPSLAALMVIGMLVPPVVPMIEPSSPWRSPPNYTRIFIEESTVAAYFYCLGGFAITLLGAGIVGLWLSLSAGRNLIPAAMQAAAYLSPLLVVATVCSSALLLLIGAAMRDQLFVFLCDLLQLPVEVVALGGWLLMTGAIGLYCLMRLRRATAAARFANR